MGRFKGQNVIVTGGTKGIGRAVSEVFLAEGANVTAVYGGDDEEAEKFLDANEEYSGNLRIARLDVSDYGAVEKFYDEYEKEHDGLDILVNNAGIRKDAVVGMMPDEDWRRVIDINLTGTFNMSKLAVRMMMRKRYGRIINISSPIGRIGFAGQANYAASKAGQVGLTKSLAREVASRKITVNCVSPGFIDTDFIADLPERTRKAYTEQVPMKRFGKAGEVARVVAFLADGDSSYITGAVMEITGGL